MARPVRAFDPEGQSWLGQPSIPMRIQLGSPASLGGTTVTYPLLDGNADFNASFLQAVRLWNQYLSPGSALDRSDGRGDWSGRQSRWDEPSIFFQHDV